ncbi:MAG: formylglycine-generating enzyme family protein, partial [Planctomycetota bacterium]|nr:formylglycine-generating enzyme family protein [Planctomycetota bacterium]
MHSLTFKKKSCCAMAGLLITWALACFPVRGQEKGELPDLASLLKTFHSEFLLVEPGKKKFPAEWPVRNPQTGKEVRVILKEPFHIAKYEIPQNLWREVMGSNPSRWKGERNSVEMLTFAEASRFCQKVTQLMIEQKLIRSDQLVRLPTDVEWEYVASAGATTRYSFGDDVKMLGDYAWFTGNAKGNDPPVGVKKPNAWGLYDVHGYLWEFAVSSWEGDRPLVHLDAKSWRSGTHQPVLRGGSWKDAAARLETHTRGKAARNLQD